MAVTTSITQYKGNSEHSYSYFWIGSYYGGFGSDNANIRITLTPSIKSKTLTVTVKFTDSVSKNGNTNYYWLKESADHPDLNTIASSGETFSWGSNSKTFTFNGTFTANKNYYLFLRKSSSANSSVAGISVSASNTTYTYSIKYNANNGTGAPSAGTKTHGASFTVSSTVPTRTGYTFKGWNTAANGTGTTYQPGSKYTQDKDVTLYAQWQINTLTIKMHVNGGTKASDASSKMTISNNIALYNGKSQTVNYGTTFNLWDYNYAPQIKLTRAGYIISSGKEFCTTSDGTGTIYNQATTYQISDFADITKGSKTVTLYVNWKTGGIVHYSDGTQWIACQMYYSDGTNWHHVMPHYSDGAQWIQCT